MTARRQRTLSARIQGAVRRTGRRLQDHTIAAGFAVAAVGALMAWVAWTSVNGVPLQERYKLHAIIPADTAIVKVGDAVRTSGRLAGIITKVEPYKRNRRVTMQLRPAFAPVGRDARTRVTVKSIIYLTYLEVFPGNVKDPLPDGGTIPVSRASSGVDLLEVVQLFDAQARRTLRTAISNTGLGLAGRGRELNQALADLGPATRNGTRQFQALTSHPGAIARSLDGAGRVTRGLKGERADDAGAGTRSASSVFGAFAARRAELGRAIELLRPFEDRVLDTSPLADPLLDRTTSLMRTLAPAFDRLAAALPDLNRALERSDALRRDTHRITGFLRPVLKKAAPILAALRDTVASTDPLLAGLESVISTVEPYTDDITRTGRNLVSITKKRYAEGRTAPGNPALRFTPIFTRAACRDPYPAPNTAVNHSGRC